VQFINYVIPVQANAPPQFFDLTSSTAFADLAGRYRGHCGHRPEGRHRPPTTRLKSRAPPRD
jgi:hypothetical protein